MNARDMKLNHMNARNVILAGLVALIVPLAACSATTANPPATSSTVIGGSITAPVILTPERTEVMVGRGTIVVFDMGDAGTGRYVATSSNSAVFAVSSTGENGGSYATNAGGVAVAAGVAEVTVSLEGDTTRGSESTVFTITVS